MDQELTLKGTIRKRKQKEYYFTKDTELGIIEFNKTEIQSLRNKIYKDKIDYPFFKLTQNIINTYKFPYLGNNIEDLQQECICFLLEKMSKYNQSKGAAYSYFGTITLRYLIYENGKAYKKLCGTYDLNEVDEDKSIVIDLLNNSENYDDILHKNYLINQFIKYIELHKYKLYKREEDLNTLEAILQIFKKRENIDIFEKKALYLYIKELTNQDSIQISKVIKKIKAIYFKLNDQYLKTGFVNLYL